MASARLLNNPSVGFSSQDTHTYSGCVIDSLLELLENHTQRNATNDETPAPAAWEKNTSPLTIDEILRRSGIVDGSR